MFVHTRRSLLVGIASAVAGLAALSIATPVACTGLSDTADHLDRALGRRRRNRCHGAHHRHAAREGAGPAGQRRQPHRRQRRRRPRGDRIGRARRLHDRHGHRRDRHDALAGADRADRCLVHAARRWSTRIRPAFRYAPTRRTRRSRNCSAAIKANPGKLKASGTGQGGIWHLALAGLLQRPEDRSGGAFPGCRAMARRRDCRTWWRAVSTVAPVSLPEARALIERARSRAWRSWMTSRRRCIPNVPTLKDAIGSDWTMAAWRGIVAPKGIPDDVRDKLAAAMKKIVAQQGVQGLHGQRGFGVIYARPGGVRQVHGEVATPNWARR